MSFFTGKGDQGSTRLFSGQQLPKSDIIFELIGTLDEAAACVGLSISFCHDREIETDLVEIQGMLSKLMGVIAGADSSGNGACFNLNEAIEWIEERIRRYGQGLSHPRVFNYAGKTTLGAAIDLTRTVIRRGERIGVRFSQERPDFDAKNLVILNRLSSFFFTLRLYVDDGK